MRVPSNREQSGGKGWIHALDGSERKTRETARPASIKPAAIKARPSDEHLSDVYEALTGELSLSERHAQSLKIRGLSDVLTHVHGYRSMPNPKEAARIARALAAQFALEGVPGFYLEKGEWRFRTYGAARGILIPIRNCEHRIVALTLRTDDGQAWRIEGRAVGLPKYLLVSSEGKPGGASSGTPPHYALLGGNFKRSSVAELIITEGALKANVSSYFLRTPVVGLVGVGCFDDKLPQLLKTAFPNLQKVKIAFDMDARTNAAVLHQRMRLTDTLRPFFSTVVLTWNAQYKGLDDYLLFQSQTRGSISA